MTPKLLIVEDDASCLAMLKSVFELNKNQVEVICASNGKEAVVELKKHSIALLITDIRMPKMNGLDLLAFVSSHYPELPCIAITAYAENMRQFKGIVNRMNPDLMAMIQTDSLRFFSKPFEVEALRRTALKMVAAHLTGGSVQGITIAALVQLVELEEKTCILEVYSQKKELGKLVFKDGVLFDAICGPVRGQEAAIRIIAAEKGRIRFKKLHKHPKKRRIRSKAIRLIFEAVRRKDELNDISRKTLVEGCRGGDETRSDVDDLKMFESEADHLDQLLSKIKKER